MRMGPDAEKRQMRLEVDRPPYEVVALKQGETATEEELIGFVKERIAGYKTPKKVVFMDSISKTAIGKILRREVREMLSDQSSEAQD